VSAILGRGEVHEVRDRRAGPLASAFPEVGMAARKEITALLRKARGQGFAITATGSGHWRVTNPSTGAWTIIAATPRGGHVLRDIARRLRRIGFASQPGKTRQDTGRLRGARGA
jgi:hypothetical protein